MRKVANLVGVSAPAIYRHYQNKEELLKEIVIEGLQVLERYLQPALEADTPHERLVQMTENYLQFAIEQPKYFDFAFLTPSNVGGMAEELGRSDWATFRQAVQQISECIEQGVFKQDDPLATAITVWAEVHGLVILFRTGRFGEDADSFGLIYRQSVRRVLSGLEA